MPAFLIKNRRGCSGASASPAEEMGLITDAVDAGPEENPSFPSHFKDYH